MKKQEIINQLKNTIAELSKNPAEADTVKALQKQLDDMYPCKYGTYLDEPFNTHGCKTCGSPKLVLCSHPKTIADRFSSKYCKPQNCKYFTPCPGIAKGGAGTANE